MDGPFFPDSLGPFAPIISRSGLGNPEKMATFAP